MRPKCDQPDKVEHPSLSEKIALTRPLPAVLLIIFILCPISVSEPFSRPETGTVIKDMNRDGDGLLIINNNWTMDTVAVLTDKRGKPTLAVYLRAKDTLEIEGIRDGEYIPYFTIGGGWNAATGDFDTVYNHCRYPPMLFETDETNYTILELDLYEADATNFVPGQFQFPDISS